MTVDDEPGHEHATGVDAVSVPFGGPAGAVLSRSRAYRYALWRRWDARPAATWCNFVGLNPSTADETADDPTIRRCVGFARAWGYGGLIMTNLFAWRSTDPVALIGHAKAVGPDNDLWLAHCANASGLVVAAWGAHGGLLDRDRAVCRLLGDRLRHLGLTKDGYPRHPLYLKRDAALKPYTGREHR